MQSKLYPLKFVPILKEKIWGGEKLGTLLHKDIVSDRTGESWEISTVAGSISVVANGALAGRNLKQLIDEYKEKLVGEKVFAAYGHKFPLLFKFIDAAQNLSLQLHPNDELALKRHNSLGKTEIWYIMQADEGAGIFAGFKKKVTKEDYLKHLQEESLHEVMNFEEVKAGDVFYIKPGLVHAIGKGVFLAEIQQNSDITYRVYDWNRIDKDGKPRELHTELALDAIDFKFEDFRIDYDLNPGIFTELAQNKYFKARKIKLHDREINLSYDRESSFIVFMAVEGSAVLTTENGGVNIKKGETVLLPAALKEVDIKTDSAVLLEISI